MLFGVRKGTVDLNARFVSGRTLLVTEWCGHHLAIFGPHTCRSYMPWHQIFQSGLVKGLLWGADAYFLLAE